jgi:hypothetical protein
MGSQVYILNQHWGSVAHKTRNHNIWVIRYDAEQVPELPTESIHEVHSASCSATRQYIALPVYERATHFHLQHLCSWHRLPSLQVVSLTLRKAAVGPLGETHGGCTGDASGFGRDVGPHYGRGWT